jgi:hypothetical protein
MERGSAYQPVTMENRAWGMLVNVPFKGLAGMWVSWKARWLGCLVVNIGVKVVAFVPEIMLTYVPSNYVDFFTTIGALVLC